MESVRCTLGISSIVRAPTESEIRERREIIMKRIILKILMVKIRRIG